MVLALVVIAVVAFTVCCALHAWWWDVKFSGRLPPGSMGWPLLGESVDLLYRHGYSNKPLPFFEQRQARYGSLFKSHLFGEPVVVSTSASINTFIFQKEGVLFKSSYPTQVVRVMGKFSWMATHGQVHAQLRKQIMCIIGPATLHRYVCGIEDKILQHLSAWERQPIVLLRKEACMLAFDLVVPRLILDDQVQGMMKSFGDFVAALTSLPIDLPGTPFNVGLKGRAKVVRILENIIQQRRNSRSLQGHMHSPKDLLDALLEEEKRDSEIFTHDLIVDVMVGVLYAAYETTATLFTFVVMLLSKHQEVVDKLMVEHMAIKRKKDSSNRGLTWEDYKSMSYTKDVVYETLRLANIAAFVSREALRDVEIEGYIIPKGWKVITSLSTSHIDPANYKDPLQFEPSRWKDSSNLKESFMPFGGGSRLCAGNDLTLLQTSIFLHYFLTKYKWSEVGKENLIRCPSVKFKYDYRIKISKMNS